MRGQGQACMHLCETGGLRGSSQQGVREWKARGGILTGPGTRLSPWGKALRVFSRAVKKWGMYGLRKLWLTTNPICDATDYR